MSKKEIIIPYHQTRVKGEDKRMKKILEDKNIIDSVGTDLRKQKKQQDKDFEGYI
jgi:hypothetical protein